MNALFGLVFWIHVIQLGQQVCCTLSLPTCLNGTYSPGVYSTEDINLDGCEALCVSRHYPNFSFAGLSSSRRCFCGFLDANWCSSKDDIIPASKRKLSKLRSIDISYDQQVHEYDNLSVSITAIGITTTDVIMRLPSNSLPPTEYSGRTVQYNLTFAGIQFGGVGLHRIYVDAKDWMGNAVHEEGNIQVLENTDITSQLICPPAAGVNLLTPLEVAFTGSIQYTVDPLFDQSMPRQSFTDGGGSVRYKMDPRKMATNFSRAFTNPLNTTGVIGMYIPSMTFHYAGYISELTLKLNDNAGNKDKKYTVKIVQPICGPGTSYCYRSNECTTTPCDVNQPNYWESKTLYSLALKRQKEVSTSFRMNLNYTVRNTLLDRNFDGNLSMTVKSINKPRTFSVFPGDMLYIETVSQMLEIVPNLDDSFVTCIQAEQCYSGLGYDISVTVVRDKRIFVDAGFNELGLFPVYVNLTNVGLENLSTSLYCDLPVEEPIANVTLVTPEAVATTNRTFLVIMPEHPGQSTCNYTVYSDAFGTFTTRDTNFTVVFPRNGLFTLKVQASGRANYETVERRVEVEDPIQGLDIELGEPVVATGDLCRINSTITQGTKVNFTFLTGDGSSFVIEFNQTDESGHDYRMRWIQDLAAQLWYQFKNHGLWTLTVTASNHVSNQTTQQLIPVQDPIKELEIIGPLTLSYNVPVSFIQYTLANGSDVAVTSSIENVPIIDTDFDEYQRTGFLRINSSRHLFGDGEHILRIFAKNNVSGVNDSLVIFVEYNLTSENVDLTIIPSSVNVSQSSLFQISLSNLSRANCTFSNGDLHKMTFYIHQAPSYLDRLQLSYAYPGVFAASLYCANGVSYIEVKKTVTVQQAVNVSLTVSSPIKLWNNTGLATFTISLGLGPHPSNASYIFKTANGNVTSVLDLSGGRQITEWRFNTVGDFTVVCEVWNLVSSQTLVGTVVVDVPVTSLETVSDKQCCAVGSSFSVTARMATGSRVSLTYFWYDGTPDNKHELKGNSTYTLSHVCNLVGVYHVKVNATNSIQTIGTVLPEPVIVQHPVPPLKIMFARPAPFHGRKPGGGWHAILLASNGWVAHMFLFSYFWSSFEFPTNASWSADFDDGHVTPFAPVKPSASVNPQFTGLLLFNHYYSVPGEYNISLTVSNCINSVTIYTVLVIYKQFEDVVLSAENVKNGGLMGVGVDSNIFPLEPPMRFSITYSKGSDPMVLWKFGDGLNDTTTVLNTTHTYSNPGRLNVRVSVSNPFPNTAVEVERTIILQRSVSKISISCASPVLRNTRLEFNVNPGSIGSNACYFIDFKDHSKEFSQFMFAGDFDECSATYPTEFQSPDRRYNGTINTEFLTSLKTLGMNPNFTVYHSFASVGIFYVQLTVSNKVSSQSYEWRVGVVRETCQWPDINMEMNSCFEPFCTPEGYKIHYRGDQLVIKAFVSVNCSAIETVLTWDIKKVVRAKNGSHILTTFQYDTPSKTSPVIVFPPRALEIGVYNFTLRVNMTSQEGMFSQKSTIVSIEPTPLDCKLSAGVKQRAEFGTLLYLDARKFADRDYESSLDLLEFHWLCKRSCETFPVYDDSFKSVLVTATSNCSDRDPLSDGGGCYRSDGVHVPGLVSEVSRGLVPVFLNDTYTGTSLDWEIHVRSGNKTCMTEHSIDVTPRKPPVIILECVKNCQHQVDKGKPFSVSSTITNFPSTVKFRYRWSLYRENPNSTVKELVPVSVDVSKVSTGLNTPFISLDENYFGDSDIKFSYALVLRAYFPVSDDSFGEQVLLFDLNGPPVNGSCRLNLDEGVAFQTRFYAFCPATYSDVNKPIVYALEYQVDPKGPWSKIIYDIPQVNEKFSFILPPGIPGLDFKLLVKLTIKDSMSASTYEFFHVKVTGDADVSKIAGPDDPMLRSLTVSRDLSGALDTVFGLVSYIDNNINKSVDYNVSNKVVSPRVVALQAKLNLFRVLKNLTEDNLKTVDQYQQTLSYVETLTRKSDQVNGEGMLLSMNYLDSVTNAMTHFLHKKEIPSTTYVDEAKNILTMTGQLTKVLQTNVNAGLSDGTTSESEDIENENGDSIGLGTTRKEAALVSRKITNVLAVVMRTMDLNTVAGEKQAELETESSKLTLVKKIPEDLDNIKIDVGFGAHLKLPPAKSLFSANASSASVATLVMEPSPIIDDDSGDTLPLTAPSVYVSLMEGNANPLIMIRLKPPLEMLFYRKPSVNILPVNFTGVQCYTGQNDVKKMTVHVIEILPNTSFHLKLGDCVNTTVNETTPSVNTTGNISSTASPTFTTPPLTSQNPNISIANESLLSQLYKKYLCSKHYDVFVKLNERVEHDNYDFHCELPLNPRNLAGVNETKMDDILNTDLYTCFRSNYEIRRKLEETSLARPDGRVSVNFGVIVKKPPSSCVQSSDYATSGGEKDDLSSYTFSVVTSQCKLFNPLAGDTGKWESTDLEEVGPYTNDSWNHCLFHRMFVRANDVGLKRKRRESPTFDPNRIPPAKSARPSLFGCGLAVPVNTINPANSAFLKLDSNPVIFAVMVAIICLYLVILIWARRADADDAVKVATTFLVDNDPVDKYLYQLDVYTGSKPHSGTTSVVSMTLCGELSETPPRKITDESRPVLQRGNIDSFIMAVPYTLGFLTHIRVWHDNSGSDPSWFFSRLVVQDLQTGQQFYFIADKWLAVEEDDGRIDRMVALAGIDDLTDFNHLFWNKARKDFFDGHLWVSVKTRPTRSCFTRVQRLTCCVSLLFSAMLANILFYDADDGSAPGTSFVVGPITVSFPEIITGIYSSLIVFPINLLIIQIFRYSKSSKTKSDKETEDLLKKPVVKRPKNTTIKELRQARYMLDFPTRFYDYSDGYDVKEPRENWPEFVDYEEPREKKKKIRFPHWCNYIAYFLCFATCGAAFYYTVEVGGVFGAAKSNKWMLSFVVSCLQDILLAQPIKVLLLAIFYALVIKAPVVEDEPDVNPPPTVKERSDGNMSWHRKYAQYQNAPMQLDEETLRAARLKKNKESEMNVLLVEIVRYAIFLYLLVMVSYGNKDPWSYGFRRTFSLAFKTGDFGDSPVDIDTVSDYTQFWQYLQSTFVPGFYSGAWYDGKVYAFSKNFTSDRHNFMMGGPRLRQVRVVNETCSELLDYYFAPQGCRAHYHFNSEDHELYNSNWQRRNATDASSWENNTAWLWQSAKDLGGIVKHGLLATYSGGGYVVDLTMNSKKGEDLISYLKETNWVDRNTRAVFIEFNLYNAALNLHAVSQILFEFDATGGIYPKYGVYILRLDRYAGSLFLVVIIAECITYLFTIYFVVVEIKKIKKLRCDYFQDFWNLMEFSTVSLLVISFAIYVYRIVMTSETLMAFRRNKAAFMNLQNVAMWDETFTNVLAFIIFIATLKSLKLLQFNKKMSMSGRILKHAAWPLIHFFLLFGIVLIAYAIMAWCLIGYKLKDWRDFIASFETLCSMMLNKFDFVNLRKASPSFAPILFITFTVIVNFTAINLFITMLMVHHSEVKEEIEQMENKFEFVTYLSTVIKGLLGIRSTEDVRKTSTVHCDNHFEEIELKAKLMADSVDDYVQRNRVYDLVGEQICEFLLRKPTKESEVSLSIHSENEYDTLPIEEKANRLSALVMDLMNNKKIPEEEYNGVLKSCHVQKEFVEDIIRQLELNEKP